MSERARILNRRTFFAGDTIFHEGDRGTQAFILQSGKVRITKAIAKSGGRQGTLGFVEPGGIFGEMALVDQSKRMATAVAEETCVCIIITEEALKQKLAKTDLVLRMLLLMLIRLLRQTTDKTPIPPDDLEALASAATSAGGARKEGNSDGQ